MALGSLLTCQVYHACCRLPERDVSAHASLGLCSPCLTEAVKGWFDHTCLLLQQALLHRAATGRPLSVLKYAMTLDGKIATSSGHAAWVSCAESRARVFAMRARSDAVIVGGNTVRRDNPNLTTRQVGGHQPVRIVMSRTLDLPEVSWAWLLCCLCLRFMNNAVVLLGQGLSVFVQTAIFPGLVVQ